MLVGSSHVWKIQKQPFPVEWGGSKRFEYWGGLTNFRTGGSLSLGGISTPLHAISQNLQEKISPALSLFLRKGFRQQSFPVNCGNSFPMEYFSMSTFAWVFIAGFTGRRSHPNTEFFLVLISPGSDTKMSYILKQTCSFQLQICLSMYELLVSE